ncbi:hypothetical protein ACFQE5_07650 [Pseudonocardia hispaniensis]|uniref:Uncharacterized protein n=1 Tax=Pseudonocardia hispaniensis TaxID=904933 RepID=A0ABW1J0B3_9PSEU
MAPAELSVLVQGDLPREVLQKIGRAVRQAALDAIADLDLQPPLVERPLADLRLAKTIRRPLADAAIGGPIGFFVAQVER